MTESKNTRSIVVQGRSVAIVSRREDDYISLTDIARYRDAERTDYLIQNWLRNRNTIEFLGIWEQLNNPAFNPIEFDGIRRQAGLNSFILTAKRWIEATGAVGITSKAGRYGGTYAHKDIAFEFATWISMEFKLYLIKEFQRLKTDEAARESREWSFQRTLAKVNYRIHTDAIQEHLIPPTLSKAQISFVYASEADLLNVALFGTTAAEWRKENPKLPGNLRDHATLEQLVVLSNLESLNSVLIHQGLPARDRLQQLNAIAIVQVRSLVAAPALKRLTTGKKPGSA
ncbi:MAG: KilA-N domain-containing protein [Polyangiaceae bacterium]|jgi:hypothetical protein|nr:KilA-N domain-containing protein [Polyangiaceae bacterium]